MVLLCNVSAMKVCAKVVKFLLLLGLRVAADDIQGLCGIAAEIPWQAPPHALLFRCHHTGGEQEGRDATIFP